MRISFVRTLVLVAMAAFAGHGAAREAQAAVDIDGDWHFRIGNSGGAVYLRFPGTPNLGAFDVTGAGYSAQFDTAFAVSDDAVQSLQFSSTSNIYGSIALEDTTRTTSIGTLDITSGRLNAANSKCLLKGTLQLNGEPPRKVALFGERLVQPDTQPTGLTFDGGVLGQGVRSTKFQIQLLDERLSGNVGVQPPLGGIGHPFYYLYSGGPVRIDGFETAGVTVQGLLVADSRGRLFGHVTSNGVLGGGALVGRVKLDADEESTHKTFRAFLRMDDGRRVWVAGSLD